MLASILLRVTSMNILLENKVTSNKMVASGGLSMKLNHSECSFLEKLSYSKLKIQTTRKAMKTRAIYDTFFAYHFVCGNWAIMKCVDDYEIGIER